MAVHLSIGRIPAIFLLALLGLAAGTAHFLSPLGPEAEAASASRITVTLPSPAEPSSSALEPDAAGTLPGSPAETGYGPEPAMPAERATEAVHTASVPVAAPAVTPSVGPFAAAEWRTATPFPKLKRTAKRPRDANLTIAPRYVPKGDWLLGAYSTAAAPKAAGVAVPGLLGIANQATRAQGGARPKGVKVADARYSLADAMRDALWRKQTAAMLRSLVR